MTRHSYIFTLFASVLCILSGCSREYCNCDSTAASNGPSDVMLMISSPYGSPNTKSAADYQKIETIRIYAYLHGSSDTAPVGYAYYPDITTDGPYYCPVFLETSGTIDFIVILNDARINSPARTPEENMTRSELDGITFTGLKGTEDQIPVPMCNERSGDGIGSSNFSFTVSDTDEYKLIPIDVKRSVSQMRLNFAKNGESAITVTGAVLYNGPDTAPLTLQDSNINGTGLYAGKSVTLIQSPVELQTGSLKEMAQTMLLPNPYGSSSPDTYSPYTSGYNNIDRVYRIDVSYEIQGTGGYTEYKQKSIYMPAVRANQSIDINCVIGDKVESSLEIIATPWKDAEMDIEFN